MKTYRGIPFSDVDINMGFWQDRQTLNRDVTTRAVMNQFMSTGRFAALRCNWREGQPQKPHIFWDSDIAKWIESVAYLVEKQPMPDLEQVVEETIDQIEKHQDEYGYVNSYFTAVEPGMRWHRRWAHELYCAGHLMEAAVAWQHATGRDRFLRIMCRYADYIDQVFRQEKSACFGTPGHEEIELALVKLYHATGNEKYLTLSKYFVDQRGQNALDWNDGYYVGTPQQDGESPEWARRANQSHLPARQQETAEGHAVRACYFFSGMADIARECGDEELKSACEKLFDNIVGKRMYITGGIGSSRYSEAFTVDYDLPNETAYTETCAAIALCYFAQRMLLLSPQRKYADVIERVIYNGFLSGTSLNGKEFFYSNPIEIVARRRFIHPSAKEKEWLPAIRRVEVFRCSCCPPNITRLVASIGDYLYTQDDDTLYMHQYMGHTAKIGGGEVRVQTMYPADGHIRVTAKGLKGKTLALRIPAWCQEFTLDCPYECKDGYALVKLGEETALELCLIMTPRLMQAHPLLSDAAGKAALARGPVLYCLEGVDHDFPLSGAMLKWPLNCEEIPADAYYGLPTLDVQGLRVPDAEQDWLYRPFQETLKPETLHFIPYFAFANRGESDMRLWLPVQR